MLKFPPGILACVLYAEKGATMNAQQIDDEYIRDIQKGLEKILEELMKE